MFSLNVNSQSMLLRNCKSLELLFLAIFIFVSSSNCYAQSRYKDSTSYFNKQTIEQQGKWENKKTKIKPKQKLYKSGSRPTSKDRKMAALLFFLLMIGSGFNKPAPTLSQPSMNTSSGIVQCNGPQNSMNSVTHFAQSAVTLSNQSHEAACLLDTTFKGIKSSLEVPFDKSLSDPLWGQKWIRSPQMKELTAELLKKYPKDTTPVHVAVFDNGFKGIEDALPHFFSNGSIPIKIVEGLNFKPFEHISQGDHGSHATSLIATRSAVGTSSGGIALALYQQGPRSLIYQDLLSICKDHHDPEGVTLISFSIGSALDESEMWRDEKMYPKELAKLKKEGCLLISAAGNREYRGPHSNDPTDSLLRVGSSNDRNQESKFSSVSEVLAPGENIFALKFKKNEDIFMSFYKEINDELKGFFKEKGLPEKDLSLDDFREGIQANADLRARLEKRMLQEPCEPQTDKSQKAPLNCERVSGTSFAAPLVAGILTNVQRILKADPHRHFGKLQPAEQVDLLNAIILESNVEGVVDGKVAVLLADSWNESSTKKGEPLPASEISNFRQCL